MKSTDMVILSENNEYMEKAGVLAKKLGAAIVHSKEELSKESLALCFDESGLFLTDGKNSVRADFSHLITRMKKGVVDTELVVRAARFKKGGNNLTVLDATAGFGEDSALLAAAGFSVTLYEQDAVIAALLEDAIKRAEATKELCEIASRMELICTDSISAMHSIENPPDVIYLDPMFPKRKKSALIKKKFQLLQRLETPCENEAELLEAAFDVSPRKIVIKRPAKGAFLADKKPNYSIEGKAVRYDVFVM